MFLKKSLIAVIAYLIFNQKKILILERYFLSNIKIIKKKFKSFLIKNFQRFFNKKKY